jgi:hypothetical protein
LGEPQIDNPFGILKSLDKFGFSSEANNKEIINLDDFTDSPPIRTIKGSTSDSRKSKSTDSYSSSSSNEDIGGRSDERLTKELREGSVGPPNPLILPVHLIHLILHFLHHLHRLHHLILHL